MFTLGILISTVEFEFGDIAVSTTISIGLLGFAPFKGKPWIKCVREKRNRTQGPIPDANTWVVPDVDVDTKVEKWTAEGKSEGALEKALREKENKTKRTELNKPIWYLWIEVFI